MELRSIFCESKEGYIEEFCKEYKQSIRTPDGFVVGCKNIKKKADHLCCGSVAKFQKVRATRILWPKYILLHPKERSIIRNVKDKNKLLFFFLRRRKNYLVVCRIIKDKKLDLISGYPVFGKKIDSFRKPQFPYEELKRGC